MVGVVSVHNASLRAHLGGMSRVTQAVSMEVPFWRVQRLSQGDELDGPSKDTARTLRNLLVSFESRCQASRLKCALTAAEADETGNGLLVNAAVSPSQRRSPPCQALDATTVPRELRHRVALKHARMRAGDHV